MEIRFESVSKETIEWSAVLRYFNAQSDGDELSIKKNFTPKVFCRICSMNEETAQFSSYRMHLLTSQLAEHYERIFNKKVVLHMISDEFYTGFCGF